MSGCRAHGWASRFIVVLLTVLSATLVHGLPAHADPIRDAQWHLDYLNIDEAHEYSQGAGVTVGVVDTGVDVSHPDLTAKVLPGIDLTLSGGVSGGDERGWSDTDSHGTGMAGLIAADGKSVGIAPQAKIIPIRVQRISGTGLGSARTPEAILWAAEHGATVVNISGGGDLPSTHLEAAVRAALAKNIVVVAAAGNRSVDKRVAYPAAYPGVLAVSAVDRQGAFADVSVSGPEVVIAAPGVDMTSPGLNGGYSQHTSGTSDAAAVVSGAVALVRSRYPHLTAPQVIELITSTADDKGPLGRDDQYGYGVLNIVKALTTPLPPATTIATAPQPGPGGPARWLAIGGITVLVLLAAGGVLLLRRAGGTRG